MSAITTIFIFYPSNSSTLPTSSLIPSGIISMPSLCDYKGLDITSDM